MSSRPYAVRAPLLLTSILLAALAVSCASTAELARRSDHALAAGNDRAAWQWAERAMRKEPQSPVARAAMNAAAARVVPDWAQRVRALAASDTIAAAHLSLDFGAVRAQLAGWNLPVPVDSAYFADEKQIRTSAARTLYHRGSHELRAHQPRDAYRDFTEVNEIVPGFRHVDRRIQSAYALALVRIAIVFDDDTASPELATELEDDVREYAAHSMPEKKYPFVRFLPRDVVLAQVPAGQPLGRDGAIHLGRTIGAQRVVWGRIYGLDSDTRRDAWDDRIFRRVTSRDTSGVEKVRYEPVPFRTVMRERTVSVSWSFEILDVDEETTLAKDAGTQQATARTVWNSLDVSEHADQYAFAPPDWKRSQSGDWSAAESRWKDHYGDWSVEHFLEAAHGAREHPAYRREDRGRFVHAGHPVFMDDLPPREDLAYEALSILPGPITDALKKLEAAAGPR